MFTAYMVGIQRCCFHSFRSHYSTHTVYLINLCNTFESIHSNRIVCSSFGFCVYILHFSNKNLNQFCTSHCFKIRVHKTLVRIYFERLTFFVIQKCNRLRMILVWNCKHEENGKIRRMCPKTKQKNYRIAKQLIL